MKPVGPNLWRCLGWNTQGDIGPYTCWTDQRGQLVVSPKSPPRSPASSLQRVTRARFALAHGLWRSFAAADRAAWTQAARRQHLRVSGYNLWMSCTMLADYSYARTIFRQSGLPWPAALS